MISEIATARKCVMVVDDNEHQLRLFECYAEAHQESNYVPAQSIDEALSQIATSPPDLVLLDNRLHPYADFRQTAPILREAGFTGTIVVVSADIDHPVFEQFGEFGVTAVIDKSEFNVRNYSALVSPYLN